MVKEELIKKYGADILKRNNLKFKHIPHPRKVIEPSVAFLVTSILSDTASRAEIFGNHLNISRIAAVKTGTTDNFKDAWTVRFHARISHWCLDWKQL